MPLLVRKQRTEEWKAAHIGRITSSIAAACLRLDPNKGAAAAWREARGTAKEAASNFWMERGVIGEPLARNAYECLTGDLVQETGLWVHPLLDWLGASPDGLVGPRGLFEGKCPKTLPTIVPVHHRIQCIIQCLVLERDWCDYFAWHPNEGHFLQRVHLAGEAGLIRRLKEFYDTYVTTNVEPPRKTRKRKSA